MNSLLKTDYVKKGAPEEEIKTPIITLEGFVNRQNEIQKQIEALGQKGGRHMKFLEKILDFQRVLILFYGKNIDPIEFIHTLYYKENQSLNTITITIKNIYGKSNEKQNLFLTSSALQRFLRYRLDWKLKGSEENKDTITYRLKHAIKPTIEALNKKEQEKKEIKFLRWYILNSDLKIENLNKETLNSYKFGYEKFIYIIKNVFGVSKENFRKLREFGLGARFIANAFNKLFIENNIDFTVS